MKVRRLVSAAALSLMIACSASAALAGGGGTEPWDNPTPNTCCTNLLDAAVAGVQAALTVL